MPSTIYVIIPTHGRPDLLGRTLESLEQCEKPKGYAGTWIVENGEPHGAEQVVSRSTTSLQARYWHVPEQGISNAMNFALGKLEDDALVVKFDDDLRFDPGILVAYAEAGRRQPTGSFFGGPLGIDYEQPPAPWLLSYLPPSAKSWSLNTEGPVEGVVFFGANWAAYARDLKAIQGFDTRFGLGAKTNATGEESSAQRKLAARGIAAFYVPRAKVWHYIPESRSNAEWTIERARQHGADTGLSVPTTSLRRINGHVKRRLWSELLRLEPLLPTRVAFHARYRRSAWSGFLEGQDHQKTDAAI